MLRIFIETNKTYYIHKECERFLIIFSIAHYDAINIMHNIIPLTIFYAVQNTKPAPNNWLEFEWKKFFEILKGEFNNIKIIWNNNCRQELSNFIKNLIETFEVFSDNHQTLKSIKLNKDEGDNQNTAINKINQDIEERSSYVKNYKEIKFEYKVLDKYCFVWKYYLRRLISERGKPCFQQKINQPKKMWHKLMDQLIVTVDKWKVLLILKALTLLYKNYYEIIGAVKYYQYFLMLLSNMDEEVKEQLVMLFYVTLDIVNV